MARSRSRCVHDDGKIQVLVRLRISSLATSSTEMSFSMGIHDSSPSTLSGLRPVHCCEATVGLGGLSALASFVIASLARRSFNFSEKMATLRARFKRLLFTLFFLAASSSAAVRDTDVDAEAALTTGALGEGGAFPWSTGDREGSKKVRVAGSKEALTGSKEALGTNLVISTPLVIFSRVLAGALGRRTSCDVASALPGPAPLSGLKRNLERGCIQGGAERSRSESDEAASSLATMQSVL